MRKSNEKDVLSNNTLLSPKNPIIENRLADVKIEKNQDNRTSTKYSKKMSSIVQFTNMQNTG